MSDPVKVELVGGTRDTNRWHDHRVMLVSPEIAQLVEFVATQLVVPRVRDEALSFARDWRAAPRVHADDDAIRWLCERQAQGDVDA